MSKIGNLNSPGWKLARLLLIFTTAWNFVEFFIALYAGELADSGALIGFGFDSGIETFAAVFALWSFRTIFEDEESWEAAERRVGLAVGITFIALSAYIVFEAVSGLRAGEAAAISPIGIALAAASLIIMPILGTYKLKNARKIGSSALAAEAKETIACAWLSATLLVGLAANAAAGWWWLDSVTALALVPWLVKEGIENIRGEECDDCKACNNDDDDD